MPDPYLYPEDVDAENAKLVLDFLNGATSAREIAAAVEIRGELDVGPKIAQRLLDRRTALGGFQTLAQVFATPLVGPERFTEIVMTLSGARPRRRPVAGVDDRNVEIRELREEVRALRSALVPTTRVRVRSVQEEPWLGQRVTLLAQVTDADGAPLVDVPATFTTSWGRIEGTHGLQLDSGQSVVTRTNHLGLARIRLLPPTQESLTEVQQASLETELARLDPAVRTPRDQLEALTAIARLYRYEGSVQLRTAIDVYFRDFGERIANAVNTQDALSAWPRVPATVVCFVTGDEGEPAGQETRGLGVHSVRMRNWLGAWLYAFGRLLEADDRLDADLRSIETADRDVKSVLTDIFGRVRDHVGLERGNVGVTLANRKAQVSLTRFVQENLDKFPPDLRGDLLISVNGASNTLGRGGLATLSAVETTRQDVTREIDRTRKAQSFEVAAVNDRVAVLESDAVTRQDLTILRTDVLKLAFENTEALVKTTRTDLLAIIDLKADGTRLSTIDAQLKAIETDTKRIDTKLAGFDTKFARIDTDLTKLKRGPTGPVIGRT